MIRSRSKSSSRSRNVIRSRSKIRIRSLPSPISLYLILKSVPVSTYKDLKK